MYSIGFTIAYGKMLLCRFVCLVDHAGHTPMSLGTLYCTLVCSATSREGLPMSRHFSLEEFATVEAFVDAAALVTRESFAPLAVNQSLIEI
jgi:hypothetical protein